MKVCNRCGIEKADYEYPVPESRICYACKYEENNNIVSGVFVCPSCAIPLQINLALKATQPKIYNPETKRSAEHSLLIDKPSSSLTKTQQAQLENKVKVLETLKSTGLFEVFKDAVKDAKGADMPTHINDYFYTWLDKAIPFTLSNTALAQLRNLISGVNYKAVYHSNIVGIIVDGLLKTFVSSYLISGRTVKTANFSTKLKPDGNEFINWIRTKNGYVVGRGLLFDELKGKSAGAFDTSGL